LQVVTFLQSVEHFGFLFIYALPPLHDAPFSLISKPDFGLFSSGGSGAIELCIAAVADTGQAVVLQQLNFKP
jgi:hypothetical protein